MFLLLSGFCGGCRPRCRFRWFFNFEHRMPKSGFVSGFVLRYSLFTDRIVVRPFLVEVILFRTEIQWSQSRFFPFKIRLIV